MSTALLGVVALALLDSIAVRVAPVDRAQPKPMFVALHGQCESASDTCARWSNAIGDSAFLVCPRGNVTCPQGGETWVGPKREDNVFLGVEAVRLAHPGELASDGAVLIGFSLGAPVALGMASREMSGWRGLVLVASLTIEPDVAALRGAGIERVVLAAGDLDMSLSHMRAIEKRLRAAGMPVRFVGLGKVAHALPSDLGPRMADALAWARGVGPP